MWCPKCLEFPNGTGAVHCDSVTAANDVLQKFKTTERLHHFFGGGGGGCQFYLVESP